MALRGERQIVFVTGEAGIGKTTLVDAFLAPLRDHDDVRITSGQCVEHYGPGEAYLPLLEATTRLCRGPGRERRIAALQRYAPSWLAQLPGLREPQDRDLLQQRVQGTSRERMLREMAEAAELFATRRGLVLVLEDLHWSDVSTLEWLSYIAQRREPAKLLILGTYRPAEALTNSHPLHGVVQELLARRQGEELRVTPLAEAAIADYLRSRFAREATGRVPLQELAPLLHRRTGGNPLFVVNVVDDLLQQGIVREEAGRWQVHGDQSVITESVPETLRQVIGRQVERLPVAAQYLLEVASIVGMEFSAAEVAAGLQAVVEEVDQQCESLVRQGQFLHAQGVEEWPDNTLSERYRFHHALSQAVLAERVSETQKVRVHRRVGERKALAFGERAREVAAELAVHFVEGRDYHKAVQYLQHAGKNAVRCSAHQEAVAHFTRGLDLLATLPDTQERRQHELALQVALGVPLLRTKGYAAPEVAHTYGRARELCQQIGEQPELFTALAGLCSFYLVRAELQMARMLAEQCLRLAQHAQDPALLVEAHFILGVTLFYRGELAAAQTILEQGSAFYDPQVHGSLMLHYGQDPGVACRAYASLTRWLLGYPDQALGKNHDALSLARELSHSFSVGAALHTAAWLHQYRQEGTAVQAYAEEEIAVSHEGGFVLWLAAGTILRGWALSEQGAREEGLAQMREGMAALNATGTAIAQPYQLALLAQAQGKSGQAHEGLALLDQALAAVDKTGECYYEAELYRLKGELTLAGAGPVEQEAEACLLKAIAVARQQQAKSLELRAVMSLVRLRQQQASALGSLNTVCASHTAQPIARNHLAEARELLQEVYGWFTEGFDSKDLQEAAALLRELGGTEENHQAKIARHQAKIETDDQKQEAPPPSRLLSTLPPQAAQSAIASTPHAARRTQAAGTQSLVPSPQSLSSPIPSSQPPTPNTFRSEGEYWTVSFAGTTCRLKDARGLHYIAHLLQQPHQEVHVIPLITIGTDLSEGATEAHPIHDPSLPFDHTEGFSDVGEILDPQARAAYKQRLSELREELAEAQQLHDLGRSEQLAAELDFLTHELSSAIGLGGRARRVGSPAERARVNITRAIKLALRKIGEHHPALGQHLATTIKTGAYCSYTPDVRVPTTWQR
jgi:predicted ATPase/type II secretory pathway predicted ATPase ExeA